MKISCLLNRFFYSAAAIILLPTIQAAESLPAADRQVDEAIRAHMEFLADDLLEGRGAGTTGYAIAARYVAAQFGQLGLQPGGESNSWFQTVPLIESKLFPDDVSLALHYQGATNSLDYNLDYLARPHFTATNITVRAPLVFVGYAVRAPDQEYDDLAGIDLKGKIAVVLAKAPPRFPATVLAHHAHWRQKSRALADAGAVGLITIPTPKDLEEFPWPRRIIQSRFPAMRWAQRDGTPADDFPQLKASLTVSPQGAGKLFARASKTLQETLAAAGRNEPQAFPLDMEAAITLRSEQNRSTSPNVIGVLPGRDPQRAGESLVLTAHLDHQGRGPAIQGDSIYNGAYDNAIGIALLLETARALAASGERPRRTVVFAAVTAEEKGLLGSEYMASHLPPAAGRPVANINLDMVLLTAPTRRFTVLGMEHSTLRAPVEAAARRFGIELVPDPQPERVTFIRSDQYSFIRQGVPAIFPKVAAGTQTASEPGGITPDQFVKMHYHQPSDEVSLPRDAESSVRFLRMIIDVAREVANADEPPRWNPGDFFGETFGHGGATAN